MREIKFRAWDEAKKEWDVGAHIALDGSGFVYGDEFYRSPSELVVEQFTGLRDKNGHEIYEGDILNFKGIGNHLVEWKEHEKTHVGHGERWTDTIIGFGFYTYGTPPSEATVVGNIHENPELLNG